MPRSPHAPAVVVMGVSGSGKSTIGALIAQDLGVPFVDGDSLHPVANVEKMASGTPLTDDDRWPWLAEVGRVLATSESGVVVACSALRRAYRDAIIDASPGTQLVHLHGTPAVLGARLEGRSDHFMPSSLLDSQLATLEPLQDDEPGFVVDVDQSVAEILAVVRARLAFDAG